MKTFLHIFLLLIPIIAFPQGTPQGISYQAVAYDSEGFEISKQDITVRLGILLGGVDAEASYTEVHSVTTDDFGLFSLVISQGETSDAFSSINWEEGAYLKVEVDEDLDGVYSVMGVSSFNAVPYALSAPTSDEVLSKILSLENFMDSINSIGCIDESACNYDSLKLIDDGSCIYADDGFDCDGYVNVQVGDEVFGGIVFYVDETGEHGLVASFNDLGEFYWGCIGVYVTTENQIGYGFNNTLDIVFESCPSNQLAEITAAQSCWEYEYGGYDDWFLPTINELHEMYNTIGSTNSGLNLYGFSDNYYWSSSNFDQGGIWSINFGTGHSDYYNKHYFYRVRPVRSF